MQYRNILGSVALATLLTAAFSGCGGGGGTATSTGFYLDSAVEGLDYTTSSGQTGTTGADGSFSFVTGDTVTFKLGALTLRTQSNLAENIKIVENEPAVATLLQSIDEDGDASNGIKLNTTIKTAVNSWLAGATSVSVSGDELQNAAALQTALTNAGVTGTRAVSVTEANAHVQATIASLTSGTAGTLGHQVVLGDGTIHYVDYTGAMRSAPASAAKAEYHTGTGYGNTLFDSADNKCQNCHNELYDTWKDSMHGKSWTDPIFQSKFQDFLRTHLNKIGQDKTAKGGLVYSEAKFKGVAQTCIKCHAPGAYYAGDVKVGLTKLKEGSVTTADLTAAKAEHESNTPTGEIAVVAANGVSDVLYKATFQIGHEANQEGINCAFCHSIETPRLMGKGNDGDVYTLKGDLRVGPHGPVKAAAGTTLSYNKDATDPDMNKFFRLWGPEKYSDYASIPKDSTAFDVGKSKDGRYTMTSKNFNGTDGKVHYTGGPFYGPFGVSGKGNENADDETDRKSLINPHFDKDSNNHFGNNGKSLCLSCHQRSAGAAVPAGEEGAGQFMELCSTQMAVTTGSDTPTDDTASSPKCQKCHMERIEGVLLHQWARPDLRFDAAEFEAAAGYKLTPELDEKDTTVAPGENPQRDGWLNSHAFLGASKTGHKTSATAKIQSGFSADVSTSSDGSTLTVTTTITNKTAHMFPGAHPMRRTLSRVIVTDGDGNKLPVASSTGISTFGDIANDVQPMAGKTLHSSAEASVAVNNNGSENLAFPGKVADLTGAAVDSQKFDGSAVTVTGTDATIASQSVANGVTTGTVTNAAIAVSTDSSNFTRIYGHETGKKYNGVFVVRPGFDSNMVASDTRLSPNETETYSTTYDISGKSGVSTTYKIYYMQKGANGKFLAGADGFLDQAASDAKKLLVTEVFSKTVTE